MKKSIVFFISLGYLIFLIVPNVFSFTVYSNPGYGIPDHSETYDVIIIGAGASGTAAAIQAAKSKLNVLVLEPTTWLGGMLTSAGVSAFDGNHDLPSGIFGEFRNKLYQHYGGPEVVSTGWVSNTLFEPSVGNMIFQNWIKEYANLDVAFQALWQSVRHEAEHWEVTYEQDGSRYTVTGSMLIDATELGDVAAYLNYPYFLGMDSKERFGESYAPDQGNDIIQDLTYVVILQDFGKENAKPISRPEGYDPSVFACACQHSDPMGDDEPSENCQNMINYGRLPNGKYMINWPNCGNDYYVNIVEMSPSERKAALEEAKLHSMRFAYYIQQELGFSNLGIAESEFPTEDDLPLIPYYRESRRYLAESMLGLENVRTPYTAEKPLYRTGITVGDYTIDHHHKANPDAPEIDFIKIRVPAYNVPLGSLIPKGSEKFIVAEKSIGVSNIVNGASRLQPVVLGIGQAAGALAASAVLSNKNLQEISIREVQALLLEHQVYLMPFRDVDRQHEHFAAVQRIGATGILKGSGVPYKWANQTWFYPNRELSEYELVQGLRAYFPVYESYWDGSGDPLTFTRLLDILKIEDSELDSTSVADIVTDTDEKLNRLQVAIILDKLINPFQMAVGFDGELLDGR